MTDFSQFKKHHLKDLEIVVYLKDGRNAYRVQQRNIADEGYTVIYVLQEGFGFETIDDAENEAKAFLAKYLEHVYAEVEKQAARIIPARLP